MQASRSWSTFRPPTRLLFLILLGSVPAGIAGLLFSDAIEEHLREPWLVGVMLIVFGAVMLVADRMATLSRSISSLGPVALHPCWDRAGGRAHSGFLVPARRFPWGWRETSTGKAAARFAFLLGTLAFIGAALVELPDLVDEWSGQGAENGGRLRLFVPRDRSGRVITCSRFLRTRTLLTFVIYRWALGCSFFVAAARAA